MMNLKTFHTKVVHKSFLFTYKITAAFILYGILAGILGYAFMLGFYLVDSAWVVPFIVRPSNDKILDLTGKLVSSQSMLVSLQNDRDHWDASLGEMRKQKSELSQLDKDLQTAIEQWNKHNKVSGPALSELDGVKKGDNIKTVDVLHDIKDVEDSIDAELAAGLVTKGDAAVQKTALNQAHTSHTDSRIAEVLLRDAVLQKNSTGTDLMEVLARKAELKSELVQLELLVISGEEQFRTDKVQIDQLNGAISSAQNSPYYLATKGDVKFAFVPYSNQGHVQTNAPVYACYLGMVLCYKVGTVKQSFTDEITATHPVYNTDLRGFLVELALTNEDAKSKVLFVGGKPLLF